MALLRILTIFLAFAGLIVLALTFWYLREGAVFSARLTALLKEIDRKYDRFVQSHMTLAYLEGKEPQMASRQMEEEVMEVLKPEIEAILALINAVTLPGVSLKYESPCFKNAVALTQELVAVGKGKGETLPDLQRDRYFMAFRDGMRAELAQRTLDLKTGAHL